MLRRVILVLTTVLAVGCASVPSATPELQVAALTFTPSPGMTRIYIYRSGGAFGAASRLSVAIDSQIVGRTAPGTYLMVELSPGHHRVSSATPENESAVVLETQADSVYFVKVWPKLGFVSAHSGMERMDPVEARRGIATARMVVSTWPGTPMGQQQ